MALLSVGLIPENLTVTDVWEAHLDLDALPAVLFGRRATYDELIYDADIAGGFTANWAGFSSITPDDLGGFTLVLGRRAYSMAGLAVFAGTSGGEASTSLAGDVTGPSGSNTVVAIRGEAVPALAAGVLTFDGTDLAWTTPGGSGDVVGPAGATDSALAEFSGTSGKLLKQSALSRANLVKLLDWVASPSIFRARGRGTSSFTSTTWAGIATATTLVNELTQGISRSGSSLTVTKAGVYAFSLLLSPYLNATAFLGVRVRVNGTVICSHNWFSGVTAAGYFGAGGFYGNLILAASDVVLFEYVATSGSVYTLPSDTLDSALVNSVTINLACITPG